MYKHLFERLLALVNSALWEKEIDENLFSDMTDQTWNSLYQFSIRHGVMAVAFDGLKKLPIHLQPPLKLKMSWAISTENIEKKYIHMQNVVSELNDTFRENDIRMLVFKGLNLSYCYPIPAHREFGDIDIYLFGKYDEGERCLAKAGAKEKEIPNYKHSNYVYKNILIENHAYLLDVHDSPTILNLNNILLDILKENNMENSIPQNEVLFPPAQFSAVFLIIHAIKHLSVEALSLRTYCDWALFLQTHGKEFNKQVWEKTLNNAGLLQLAKGINELTFRWLGVAPSCSPLSIETNKSEWSDYLEKEMWQPLYPGCPKENKWDIIRYKIKRLNYLYDRQILFYGKDVYKSYPQYLWSSIINHIKMPQLIFNSK